MSTLGELFEALRTHAFNLPQPARGQAVALMLELCDMGVTSSQPTHNVPVAPSTAKPTEPRDRGAPRWLEPNPEFVAKGEEYAGRTSAVLSVLAIGPLGRDAIFGALLAKDENVKKTRVSYLLHRLWARGYVVSEGNPAIWSLTAAGAAAASQSNDPATPDRWILWAQTALEGTQARRASFTQFAYKALKEYGVNVDFEAMWYQCTNERQLRREGDQLALPPASVEDDTD